jgi:hypothetical protein
MVEYFIHADRNKGHVEYENISHSITNILNETRLKPSHQRIPIQVRFPALLVIVEGHTAHTPTLYIHKHLLYIFYCVISNIHLAGWCGIVVYRYPPMMKERRRRSLHPTKHGVL